MCHMIYENGLVFVFMIYERKEDDLIFMKCIHSKLKYQ